MQGVIGPQPLRVGETARPVMNQWTTQAEMRVDDETQKPGCHRA
jgi:hypothetical protein